MAHVAPADCPIAAQVCDEILSLPLHPALSAADVGAVADAARAWAPRLQVS
jgi:dTDP-4-amino-4,6-dideoxygalactose transaminase